MGPKLAKRGKQISVGSHIAQSADMFTSSYKHGGNFDQVTAKYCRTLKCEQFALDLVTLAHYFELGYLCERFRDIFRMKSFENIGKTRGQGNAFVK